LYIEEEVVLYAPQSEEHEYAVVFSRPFVAAEQRDDEETEGGGFRDLLRSSDDGKHGGDNAGDAWLREMDAHFSALVKKQAVTGEPSPTPFFNTEDTDHRLELRDRGFTGLARRRNVVDGERLWAALYRRSKSPESAALGTATAGIIVDFNPVIGENGRLLRLNGDAQASVKPASAPEGVDQKVWSSAVARSLIVLADDVDLLEARLNAREIHAPADAVYAFDAGEPYRMTLQGRYRGESYPIKLHLGGEVRPVAGEEDGRSSEEALRDELAGGWSLRLEHPEHGWLDGFADLAARSGTHLGVYYPDGYKNSSYGCGYEVKADEGIVRAHCGTRDITMTMQMELRPDKRRMRGYWYSSGRYRGMTEETRLGRVQWRRMEPVVDGAEVEGITEGALDYKEMRWPRGLRTLNGNKPKVRLVLNGRDLPRFSTSRGLETISLPDPTLGHHVDRGNLDGTEFQVDFWLRADVKPGRKILRLNGLVVPFELAFDNYDEAAPALHSLEFVSLSAVASGPVDKLRLDGTYLLEATYDKVSGDAVKQPSLRIERGGEAVHEFSDEQVRLARNPPGKFFHTATLDLDEVISGPYTFQAGDVIVAKLDDVTQRWPLVGGLGVAEADVHDPLELTALSLAGEQIRSVAAGIPFRLALVFAEPQDSTKIEATFAYVSSGEGEGASPGEPPGASERGIPQVSLQRLTDGRTYRSAPIVLVEASDRTRETLAAHFAGVYRVGHMDYRGNPAARGRALVSEDGRVELDLHSDDSETRYHAARLRGSYYGEQAQPFLGSVQAVFRTGGAEQMQGDEEPVVLSVGGEDQDRDAFLASHRVEGRATFTVGAETLRLNVSPAGADEARLQVEVYARDYLDKLTGSWKLQGADGEASWIRAEPEIAGIVVVDDQTARMRAAYPFGEQSPSGALRTRTLVVYGKNLPDEAGQARVESKNPGVSYADVSPYRLGNQAYSVSSRADVENARDHDALALTAELDESAAPGQQTIVIDGTTSQWPLIFSDQFAALSFTRVTGDPTRTFFPGDTGYVELTYLRDLAHRDPFELRLFAGEGETERELGPLTASRVDAAKNVTFQAGPLHFVDATDDSRRPPDDTEAVELPVQASDIFTVELVDRGKAFAIPPRARARIEKDPTALGPTWRDALMRVAACPPAETGKAEADPEAYQREPSKTISRTLLTELSTRSRDEFVKLTLRETLPQLREFAANSEATTKFFEAAARGDPAVARLPLWTTYKAEYQTEKRIGQTEAGEKIEVPLREVLDFERLAQRWQADPSAMRAWAIGQTQRALAKQIRDTSQSVKRARGAGDCKLDELLVLAGQRTDPVVARILPRLMKQEHGGEPARTWWVADRPARAYVKNLHIAGEALRALERYASLDDAYKAMAVAVVTAGTAAAIAPVAGGAAGWLLVGGDVADMAWFGAKSVRAYIEGEENYAYARGAAATVGDDFLREAMGDRQSPFMTAVGVIAPGIAGVSGVRHLRNLRAISRGRNLLASGDDVLSRLNRLSDAERADMAAYYTDLVRRSDRLSAADRAAYNRFRDYFEAAGLPPVRPDGADEAARPAIRPSQLSREEMQAYHDALARQQVQRRRSAGEAGEGGGSDVLRAPVPDESVTPATPDELDALHAPGRELTREQIARKPELYAHLERLRRALAEARERGRPQNEIDLLQDEYEELDAMLARATAEARAAVPRAPVDPDADTVIDPGRNQTPPGSAPRPAPAVSSDGPGPRFDRDAETVTDPRRRPAAQPGDTDPARPPTPSESAARPASAGGLPDTVPPPRRPDGESTPAGSATTATPQSGSFFDDLTGNPLYTDIATRVEAGEASDTVRNAFSAVARHRRDMPSAARMRADRAFAQARDLFSSSPAILPGGAGPRNLDEALSSIARTLHVRAGQQLPPHDLLAEAVAYHGIDVTPANFARAAGISTPDARQALARAYARMDITPETPSAGTGVPPETPGPVGSSGASTLPDSALTPGEASSARRVTADELTPSELADLADDVSVDELRPSELANLGDEFGDQIILGERNVDDVLAERYPPGALPRVHTTSRQNLMKIVRSGVLEPSDSGPNFSKPGVGTARAGEVVIRVRPEVERYIQWNTRHPNGDAPIYWPSGAVNEGPRRASIPTSLLEYLDTGSTVRKPSWRSFPPN